MVFKLRYFFFILTISIGHTSFGQKTIEKLREISSRQFKEGKYDDALITSIKILRIAEKNKNCSDLVTALLTVGKMEYYIIHKRKALDYFFKSLGMLESCNSDSIRNMLYGNIGAVLTDLGKNDSALIFLIKSKELLEKTKNYGGLSKVNAVLADLYLGNFNNVVEGEKYLIEAEKYAELSKSKTWIAFALMKRGIFHKLKKEYPKAITAFNGALKIYEEMRLKEGRRYALGMIIDVIKIYDNSELNIYWGKYMELRDSMYHGEMATKIAEYETLYKTEKKESENKLLLQKNKLNQTEIDAKNKTIVGLIIGVLLIVITVFWRISVLNLKKKNRELEAAREVQKEKERISRDLHDNVGGQLSYVLYSLDGINEKDKQKRAELTTNINESVRNVISNLRETIWAINDESITIQDFSDKLKVYARSMFRNTETKIVFNERIENNIELNSATGLNLYRICQEIINNAFKHSKADELKIEITANEKTTIVINDNGIGFDTEKDSNDGFGLSNIKSRANETGIILNLKAKISRGVAYSLVV